MHVKTTAVGLLTATLLALTGCSFGSDDPTLTRRYAALDLRDEQRAFWVDHLTWSHTYAIAAINGLGDVDVEYDRLLEGVAIYDRTFIPMYGDDAERRVNRLLRQHVAIEKQLFAAVKACDQASVEELRLQYYGNLETLANVLADINPSIDGEQLKFLFRGHLDHELALVQAVQAKDWNADVAQYDQGIDNGLAIADLLVKGFETRFPNRVRADVVSFEVKGELTEHELTQEETQLHLAMRELWSDHVMYTRFYLVLAIARLQGTDQIAARLLANQLEIGNAVKPYFGEAAGDALGKLLQEHILIATKLVEAAMLKDAEAQRRASAAWTANANAIAAALAAVNPAFVEADLAQMLSAHLAITLEEAVARLEGRWRDDVVAYDRVVQMIYEMADMLTLGIIQYRLGLAPEQPEQQPGTCIGGTSDSGQPCSCPPVEVVTPPADTSSSSGCNTGCSSSSSSSGSADTAAPSDDDDDKGHDKKDKDKGDKKNKDKDDKKDKDKDDKDDKDD
jgi:hypothetical protein